MGKALSIGVSKTFPVYTSSTQTVSVTASNITSVFTVTNNPYYFVGSGSTFTTNNAGVNGSIASTTLKALYDMTVSFTYSYSSEANYDKFTLQVGSTYIENAVSGSTTTKTYSGSIKAGDTIFFSYSKDSSTHRNNDQCTFSAMSVTYTKKTQTGTETKSVASKGKKVWIGVGGKARKVKKMWIGVAGKARLFFSGGGTLKYKGALTNLTYAANPNRCSYNCSFGDYVVFRGTGNANIETFNKSLTKTVLSATISDRRRSSTTVTVGGHFIYALGNDWSTGNKLSTYKVLDSSLTLKSDLTGSSADCRCTGCSIKNYGIVAGGNNGTTSIRVINSSLSLSVLSATLPSYGNYDGASVEFNGKAFFSITNGATIAIVSEDLTVSSLTPGYSTFSSYYPAWTKTSGHIIISANYSLTGSNNQWGEGTIAISPSLTTTVLADLNIPRINGSAGAMSLGGSAIIAGGGVHKTYSSAYVTDVVDVYNEDLTHLVFDNISVPRYDMMCGNIGEDFAIAAGGISNYNNGTLSTAVDAYYLV